MFETVIRRSGERSKPVVAELHLIAPASIENRADGNPPETMRSSAGCFAACCPEARGSTGKWARCPEVVGSYDGCSVNESVEFVGEGVVRFHADAVCVLLVEAWHFLDPVPGH